VRDHVQIRFFKILRLKRNSKKVANFLKFNFVLLYKCDVNVFKILSKIFIYKKGSFRTEKTEFFLHHEPSANNESNDRILLDSVEVVYHYLAGTDENESNPAVSCRSVLEIP
jgi:hypothetical protein